MTERAAVMFSGAAGSSLGVRLAGGRVVWAANHEPACVELHRANFPEAAHVCEDLVRYDHGLMPEHEILVASPVCRGYSRAGRPARAHSQSSASRHNKSRATLWSVIDALEIHQPRAFVVENVSEIQDWPLFHGWLECVRLLGYTTTVSCLTASRWGVPQRRERLFAVGLRGRSSLGPLVDPQTAEPGVEHVIDWDAGEWRPFSDCRGKEARPQLERAAAKLRGGIGFALQVDCRPICPASEPMHTMTRKLMSQTVLVKGRRYRKPTAREAFRFMGFPDDYVIPESLPVGQLYEMAGDAVCPPVMRGVFERVVEATRSRGRRRGQGMAQRLLA